MKNVKYDLIADCHKAKENRVWNAIVAFVVGGFIGLIGEGIIELLCLNFSLSRNDASTFMIVIYRTLTYMTGKCHWQFTRRIIATSKHICYRITSFRT